MPTQKEFDDLKALVDRIAATPKVKAYLDGSQWPRPMSMGEGVVSSGEQDKLAWESAHPKPKRLVEAEAAVAEAEVQVKVAQFALLEASRVEKGGRYLSQGLAGSVVVDVVADSLIQVRKDVPEWKVAEDAGSDLIAAKVRMFKLQREREAERIADDRKVNPPNPPSKESQAEMATWPKRVRMAAFGGKR